MMPPVGLVAIISMVVRVGLSLSIECFMINARKASIFDENGTLQVNPGERAVFKCSSAHPFSMSTSPFINWASSSTQERIEHKQTSDSTTSVYTAVLVVQVENAENGWVKCRGVEESNKQAMCKFAAGKIASLPGHQKTFKMRPAAPRTRIPCISTHKKVTPVLRKISPANLRHDHVKYTYDPEFGFTVDDRLLGEETIYEYKCREDEKAGRAIFSRQTAIVVDNKPWIIYNSKLGVFECKTQKAADIVMGNFTCDSPNVCDKMQSNFEHALSQYQSKLSECPNCKGVVLFLPLEGGRLLCFASGEKAQRDFYRTASNEVGFNDEVPPKEMSLNQLASSGNDISFECSVPLKDYWAFVEMNIVFKNGSAIRLVKPTIDFLKGYFVATFAIEPEESMEELRCKAFSRKTQNSTFLSTLIQPGLKNATKNNIQQRFADEAPSKNSFLWLIPVSAAGVIIAIVVAILIIRKKRAARNPILNHENQEDQVEIREDMAGQSGNLQSAYQIENVGVTNQIQSPEVAEQQESPEAISQNESAELALEQCGDRSESQKALGEAQNKDNPCQNQDGARQTENQVEDDNQVENPVEDEQEVENQGSVSLVDSFLLNREDVILETGEDSELGQGKNGVVRLARLANNMETRVVVKLSIEGKEGTLGTEVEIFRTLDQQKMKDGGCNNILSSLGYYMEQNSHGRPCKRLVLEFCEHRDLLHYLNSDHYRRNYGTYTPEIDALCLRWSQEMLTGVMYLRKLGMTHKDLHIKNVMVTSDLTVKLGDFGAIDNFTDYTDLQGFGKILSTLFPKPNGTRDIRLRRDVILPTRPPIIEKIIEVCKNSSTDVERYEFVWSEIQRAIDEQQRAAQGGLWNWATRLMNAVSSFLYR